MAEIRLSPRQAQALQLLAERDPVAVETGLEVHGAVAEALIGQGLAVRPQPGARRLRITDEGRAAAARLAGAS
jgi:hypothetical protein